MNVPTDRPDRPGSPLDSTELSLGHPESAALDTADAALRRIVGGAADEADREALLAGLGAIARLAQAAPGAAAGEGEGWRGLRQTLPGGITLLLLGNRDDSASFGVRVDSAGHPYECDWEASGSMGGVCRLEVGDGADGRVVRVQGAECETEFALGDRVDWVAPPARAGLFANTGSSLAAFLGTFERSTKVVPPPLPGPPPLPVPPVAALPPVVPPPRPPVPPPVPPPAEVAPPVVSGASSHAATDGSCAHCGHAMSPGARFCPQCGNPRTAARTCRACGRAAKNPDAKFCAGCGAPMASE